MVKIADLLPWRKKEIRKERRVAVLPVKKDRRKKPVTFDDIHRSIDDLDTTMTTVFNSGKNGKN